MSERPLDIRPLAKYAHLLEGSVELQPQAETVPMTASEDPEGQNLPVKGSAVRVGPIPAYRPRRRSPQA